MRATNPGIRPAILVGEPDGFAAEAAEILGGFGDVRLHRVRPAELAAAIASVDVFWFRLAHRITDDVLGASPRCRILATPVTGLDHIDLDACARLGVRVVSLRGEIEFLRSIKATAELTLGLVLALLRHIPAAAASVRDGEWDRDRFRGRELATKTAGIIGMGRLGCCVAEYFHALGMRVVGYDPRPDFPHALATRASSLQEVLAVADVVSLHVPLTAATTHLISEPELAQMKPDAVLINTSRGGIVDEAALLRALESGRLSGAALDVVTTEPHVDPAHPVLEGARRLPNLLVVPHLGGNTIESTRRTEVFLAHKVREAWIDASR